MGEKMYIIGIVGRSYFNKDNQEIFQIHESIRRVLTKYDDVIPICLLPPEDYDYHNSKMGKDIVNKDKLNYILDKCDGFIVPSGTYFHNFDEYIINYTIKKDKPLLAVCLGFQLMCSMFAKNRDKFDMTIRLKDNSHYGNSKKYLHEVNIIKNTKLSKIVNKSCIPVNSVHKDTVTFKMNKLVINAVSDDGVIEGVEYPNKKFIMGLEWHPESLFDDYSKLIFDSFYKSIKKEPK